MTLNVPTRVHRARRALALTCSTLVVALFLCFAHRPPALADEPPPGLAFDFDLDGVEDYGIGDPGFGMDPQEPGLVALFSGADDSQLWLATGERDRDAFGAAVAVIADLNGDGVPEVLGAAPARTREDSALLGAAYVLDGATGGFLRAHEGDSGDWFGLEVAPTIDRNGDGVADYSVYGLAIDDLEREVVRKWVHSGATGQRLYALSILREEAEGGLTPGDVNDDGLVDVGDVSQVVQSIGQTGDDLPEDVSANSVVDAPDVSITLTNVGQASVVPLDSDGEPWPDFNDIIPRACGWIEGYWYGDWPTCNNGPGPGAGDDDPDDGGGTEDPGDHGADGGSGDSGARPWGRRPGGSDNGSACPCSWASARLEGPDYVPVGQPAAVVGAMDPIECGTTITFDIAFGEQFVEEVTTGGGGITLLAGPNYGDVIIRAFFYCAETGSRRATAYYTLHIVAVDLDIDSDNSAGLGPPERDQAEEDAEDESGAKVIVVNRDDVDGDGIPDYADGFGAFDGESAGGTAGDRFVPLILDLSSLPPLEGVEIVFDYDAADPAEVSRVETLVPALQSAYFRYGRGPGLLRIWRLDAAHPRGPEDFVPSGEPIDFGAAGETLVLLVEAVNGSPSATTISVTVMSADRLVLGDAVRVLPFDSVTGLAETEIDGFEIIHGSTAGTPGNDIILGTDLDDFIQSGFGDDIIVGGAGNDSIEAGAGADVVFASRGYDLIDLGAEDGGIALQDDDGIPRAAPDADKRLHEEDRPFTTEQVIEAYGLIYGEDDPWMKVYTAIGGKVEAVEGDGVPFSESDWDRVGAFSASDNTFVIQVQFSLDSPFLAACRVRRELLHMVGHIRGPGTLFGQHLLGQAFSSALGVEPHDFETHVQTWGELRLIALDNAIEASALVTNVALSVVGVASEFADIVVSIGDVADGNYLSSLAFLPFISSTTLNGVLLAVRKADGSLLWRMEDDIVYGADSGIGWVARDKMAFDMVEDVTGNRTLVLGTAQAVTEGGVATTHAATINRIVRAMAESGEYEYITMNRAWSTATGRQNPLNERPDIIGVRRDGTVDAFEVASNGQDELQLLQKLDQEMISLPAGMRGVVRVFRLDPE